MRNAYVNGVPDSMARHEKRRDRARDTGNVEMTHKQEIEIRDGRALLYSMKLYLSDSSFSMFYDMLRYLSGPGFKPFIEWLKTLDPDLPQPNPEIVKERIEFTLTKFREHLDG
jgi:hypothetical protein